VVWFTEKLFLGRPPGKQITKEKFVGEGKTGDRLIDRRGNFSRCDYGGTMGEG